MPLEIFNPSEIIDFVTFQGHAQVGAPRWKGFTGLAYHQLRLASKAKVYSETLVLRLKSGGGVYRVFVQSWRDGVALLLFLCCCFSVVKFRYLLMFRMFERRQQDSDINAGAFL
jgi:hypothetical protein